MSGLNGAAIFVIQTLGSLYLLIVLLRFILQLVRANFYNPLCQFTVKATQPLLKPLRRVIPSLFGLDMSSLVLAILVQMVIFAIVLTLSYMSFNILGLLAWAIIGVTALFLKVFFLDFGKCRIETSLHQNTLSIGLVAVIRTSVLWHPLNVGLND